MTQTNEPQFMPLWDLLTRFSAQVLSTAVENHGVQGWDRYGRFTTCTKDSTGDELLSYRCALDAIAAEHAWDRNHEPDQHELSPAEYAREMCVEGDTAFHLGWFENQAPDFEAINAGVASLPKQPKPKDKGYRDDAMYGVIGGLLMFIQGRLDPSIGKHPNYHSQTQLAELMEDRLRDISGLSKRNLEDKFAAANKAMAATR